MNTRSEYETKKIFQNYIFTYQESLTSFVGISSFCIKIYIKVESLVYDLGSKGFHLLR